MILIDFLHSIMALLMRNWSLLLIMMLNIGWDRIAVMRVSSGAMLATVLRNGREFPHRQGSDLVYTQIGKCRLSRWRSIRSVGNKQCNVTCVITVACDRLQHCFVHSKCQARTF